MRMRYKPYARPELAAWPHSVDDPPAQRGRWAEVFSGPTRPLRLDLGCGKGVFLADVALRDGGYNHLGLDIKSEVLVVAKRNIEQLYAQAGRAVDNVAIASQEIERIGDALAVEDDIERIYINFCNPWYKSGHAKHRLTHPRQLVCYRDFLREGGEIWFKTDDDPLFADSLRYFEYTGFEVNWLSRDLHRDEPAFNVRTEHENMFAARGVPIKMCIAKMVPAQLDRAAISKLKNI